MCREISRALARAARSFQTSDSWLNVIHPSSMKSPSTPSRRTALPFSTRHGFTTGLMLVLVLASSAVAQFNAPAGGGSGQDVKLEERGDQVTLDNGIVSATVIKSGASITSLKFKNNEMVN